MSDTEKPETVQGNIGMSPEDVSYIDPSELSAHPKNREIYGDTESSDDIDDNFVESVSENGVIEPLVATTDKQIISGHRRWIAAKTTDVETVPVRTCEFDDDLAEREALVEFNRQREKTPGQIVNEFEEMLEIEQERAKERKSHGETAPGKNASGNVSNSVDTGAAREKAAEKVNADVSGRTLEKGKKVKDKAESDDEPDRVQEEAKKEWEKLKNGNTSFHRANKNVEKVEAEDAVQQQRDTDTGQATVHRTDATSLINSVDEEVNLLLTDPPYSTDVDDIAEFAKSWVPDALSVITSDGFAFIFIGAYPDEIQSYLNVINNGTPWSVCQVLVWTYKNTLGRAPNDRYKLNWQAILYIRGPDSPDLNAPKTSEQWAVQDVNAPDGRLNGRHHKWEKPTELADRLIRHTTTENDTVIDPFAGTGTFPLTAAKLNRDVIACDSDTEMLEIASERGCIVDE
jgi:16S rRNA G966 N2-methylase RsmD